MTCNGSGVYVNCVGDTSFSRNNNDSVVPLVPPIPIMV